MAFGGFQQEGAQPLMSEINTTPLVDVMLVLLAIFMITAPLFTHAVHIDLPRASAAPLQEKREAVHLAVNADGDLYWNDRLIGDEEFQLRLHEAALLAPQPELHLRADRTTRYERLAEIMAAAQNAGIARMGFVTVPESR
ncbi:MAG: biopolymer transporter ExbD [Pseudomonadota bacterium]|jgi:biopolymer transport protein ExbD